MVKGEQNHQKTIDANRSLGKKPSYPIAPKKWPLFTSITNTQNLWRLQEVPLQDQEMTKMGARQCSSETVTIVHTFFRVCHRNLWCLQCVNHFTGYQVPRNNNANDHWLCSIPGWWRRGQGDHVLQMQNESGKAGFLCSVNKLGLTFGIWIKD